MNNPTLPIAETQPPTGQAGADCVQRLVSHHGRTHLDLFSGIGGFALAAASAGFQTIGFSEINPYACKILKRNWPDVPNYGDVRNVPAIKCDLITGGFPCQPYSRCGQRAGNDDSRALWPAMLRVIRESKPAWVLGENVSGVIEMALDGMCADLEEAGYEVGTLEIPACAVNARHRRERVWIIANSKDVLRRAENGGVESGKSASGSEAQGRTLRQGMRHAINDGLGSATEFGRGNRWDAPSSRICGRTHGIPNRMDRLKSLGNAIVPQVAAVIMQAIKECNKQ
jgi:DNA (cytosine-5)-methyltransferase 1